MYDFLKRIKTNALVTAALYAALGLVLFFWPALSTNVLCTALGAVLLVCGGVDIVIFLTHRDGTLYAAFHLVLGIILAAVGAWLIARPTLVAVVIPRIMGVLICIHGAGDLGDALTLRQSGYPRWTAALVLGLVTLALGALLVFCPFEAFTTAVRLIGAFLVYDGVSSIWITTRVGKMAARAFRDGEAVDVEFRDMED